MRVGGRHSVWRPHQKEEITMHVLTQLALRALACFFIALSAFGCADEHQVTVTTEFREAIAVTEAAANGDSITVVSQEGQPVAQVEYDASSRLLFFANDKFALENVDPLKPSELNELAYRCSAGTPRLGPKLLGRASARRQLTPSIPHKVEAPLPVGLSCPERWRARSYARRRNAGP
jgi:hypothetical protein